MTLCLGCFIMCKWFKQCLEVLGEALLVQLLEHIKQPPTHTQKHACINITMEEQHIEATQWMQQTQYCNLNFASPPSILSSSWQRTHQHWLTQQTAIHVQDNHKQTAIHLQTNNNTFTNTYNTSKHCKPLPRVCGSAMVSQLAGIGGEHVHNYCLFDPSLRIHMQTCNTMYVYAYILCVHSNVWRNLCKHK